MRVMRGIVWVGIGGGGVFASLPVIAKMVHFKGIVGFSDNEERGGSGELAAHLPGQFVAHCTVVH